MVYAVSLVLSFRQKTETDLVRGEKKFGSPSRLQALSPLQAGGEPLSLLSYGSTALFVPSFFAIVYFLVPRRVNLAK